MLALEGISGERLARPVRLAQPIIPVSDYFTGWFPGGPISSPYLRNALNYLLEILPARKLRALSFRDSSPLRPRYRRAARRRCVRPEGVG
jgi:hypothetical protein